MFLVRIKIDELNDTLLPIYKLIKQGGFQHSNASEFIINKTKLYLMYCAHLSFYFILKSKRLTVENHPIVKNIIQYRNVRFYYNCNHDIFLLINLNFLKAM